MTASPAVNLRDVTYRYPGGTDALSGVSLRITAGERVAIIGENGAGKTTLLRHLNGMIRPTSGQVAIAGRDAAGREIAELAHDVAFLFQNPDEQLFARTVQRDIEFGPRNLGCTPEQAAERARAALEAVGLSGAAESHPHELSWTDRKRVALAGVLAMQSPIVALDEPTTGQDAHGVNLIAAIIQRLAEQGCAVIAVTHDMDFCAENFDRVIVMAAGRVVADGPTADTFARVDALSRARVEPPQLMRLAVRLGWSAQPLCPADVVAILNQGHTP